MWVHEKERTGETYEEIRGNFFLRFNQAVPSAVKSISKKRRPHNVQQLAVVLLKRKLFNYSDGFCLTTEERDHSYLQNDRSRNAQAGKQRDMAEHSTVRGK